MRLLLTRPEEDAQPLAEELEALGHSVVIAPLMQVQFVDGVTPDLDGVQAVLLTSANGARALARATAVRDVAVLAVGAATADAARAAGFNMVESADGDVIALAELVRRRCQPEHGALLHVSGHDVAGDLAGMLTADGFEVRRSVLYRARAVDALPQPAVDALAGATLDAVVLFSPRTATIFARLLQAQKLETACRNLDIYALSKAVAASAIVLPWRGCHVAVRPTQADLVNLLRQGTGMSDKDEKRPGEPWGKAGGATPLEAEAVEPGAGTEAGEPEPIDVEAKEAADAAAGTIDAEAVDGEGGREEAVEAGEPIDTEAEAVETELSAQPPVERKSGFGTVLVVLLVIVVGGAAAAYFAWPQIAGRLGLGPATAEVDLDSDLTALTRRLDRLERTAQDQSQQLSRLGTAMEAFEAAGQPAADGADTAAVEDMQARIAALEEAVKALPTPPAATGDGMAPAEVLAQLAALGERVEALASRPLPEPALPPETQAALAQMSATEQALATAREQISALSRQNSALNTQLQQVTDRLAGLEQQLAQQAAAVPAGERREALVLAVGQLREAVLSGRAYGPALQSVAALAGDSADLAAAMQPLQAHQGQGIVTREDLRRRFDDMASAVMRAGATAEPGIVDRTINRLSNLVVIRRTGEIEGNEPDAILARAEQRLAAGDLAAAVAELSGLSGPRAEAAAPWVGDAQARLAAEAALADLQARAIQAVAGG